MSAPSLHEIAAMPYPQSIKAMREHYVHDWGKPIPDGASTKQTYAVEMLFTLTVNEHETIEIEAWSEAETIAEAEDQVSRMHSHAEDIDFLETKASVRGVSQ